ncbi:hypothetical protein CERZMDRAFT_80566 [Cercospora zeae-maydis SCOH1-5]|uniref:Uncharacterized protein n=1 Tax=Cercospora zeae-maydis SCOH1-5 TaxID=717836 RepID=A0A6A6FX58_9PEZI|nr:hypothetical protein CERZMDRAFT_80566 [Cercospora zeae-maydis SCOH1-5]
MDGSPFGKLAAELRNKIYENVLIHDEPIEINVHCHSWGEIKKMVMTRKHSNARLVELVADCRQTRAECTELFPANNHFKLRLPFIDRRIYLDITGLDPFISTLGTSVQRHLRHVTVQIISGPRGWHRQIGAGAVSRIVQAAWIH